MQNCNLRSNLLFIYSNATGSKQSERHKQLLSWDNDKKHLLVQSAQTLVGQWSCLPADGHHWWKCFWASINQNISRNLEKYNVSQHDGQGLLETATLEQHEGCRSAVNSNKKRTLKHCTAIEILLLNCMCKHLDGNANSWPLYFCSKSLLWEVNCGTFISAQWIYVV